MTEVIGFFGFILAGSVALVVALNMTHQRREEKESRRYLNALARLEERRNRRWEDE